MDEHADIRLPEYGWDYLSLLGELVILNDTIIPDYTRDVEPLWECIKNNIRVIRIRHGCTRVGACWFRGCKNLVKVILPSTLTTICKEAFDDCENLLSIELPRSLVEIGDYAFYLCKRIGFIDLPYGLRSIGEFAFYKCEQLVFTSFPSTLRRIKRVAFYGCKQLKSFKIPEGVEEIQASLFDGCASLEEVVIPNSVRCIRNCAFKECSNLKSVTLPESIEKIDSLCFSGCIKLETINLPDSIIELCSLAFERTNLRTVVLPKKLKKIDRRLCNECPNLQSVVIPYGVTSIGDDAFANCPLLQDISIPESVINIGKSAFKGCTSLAFVDIPNGVSKIRKETFKDCTNLAGINIPPSVTQLGRSAFENCSRLAPESIPGTILNAGEDAFLGCADSLVSKYKKEEPVLGFNGTCCEGIRWSYDKKRNVLDITGEGPIEDNSEAWLHLSHHVKEVRISDGITRIGAYTFRDFKKLIHISFGKDVESIDTSAFDGCCSLKSIITSENRAFSSEDALFTQGYEKLLYVPPSANLLSIQKGTNHITRGVFSKSWIHSIRVDKSNEAFTEMNGCLFSKDLTALLLVPWNVNTCFIPESTEYISDDALMHCMDVGKFEVDEKNQFFTAIDGVLFTKDLSTLIRCPPRKEWNCSIPAETIEISGNAFLHCGSLHLFEVAEGNQAFTVLNEVLFTKDLEELISYPSKREKVVFIPKSTVRIHKNAFQICSHSIDIVVDKDNPVFSDYKGSLFSKDLSTLILASKHVKIPKETVFVERDAFKFSEYLFEIEVSPDNAQFTIYNRCLFSKDLKTLFCAFYTPHRLVIPDETTTMLPYSITPGIRNVRYPYRVIIDENEYNDGFYF